MPLHPALEELIGAKIANTRAPQWQLSIEEVRASFRALWVPTITGGLIEVASAGDKILDTAVGLVKARVFIPENGKPLPLMMYFHGGGYVKGGVVKTDPFCRRLAKTTGNVIVSIDYRLAPENPYPAALADAYSSTVWAYEHAGTLGGMSVCRPQNAWCRARIWPDTTNSTTELTKTPGIPGYRRSLPTTFPVRLPR